MMEIYRLKCFYEEVDSAVEDVDSSAASSRDDRIFRALTSKSFDFKRLLKVAFSRSLRLPELFVKIFVISRTTPNLHLLLFFRILFIVSANSSPFKVSQINFRFSSLGIGMKLATCSALFCTRFHVSFKSSLSFFPIPILMRTNCAVKLFPLAMFCNSVMNSGVALTAKYAGRVQTP